MDARLQADSSAADYTRPVGINTDFSDDRFELGHFNLLHF
jgi:hypothetical protein